MSSEAAPPTTGPAPKESKKKKGVEKVLYRVRAVFRRGERPKKQTAEQAPAPAPALLSPPVAPGADGGATAPPKKHQYENATRVPRIQVHEERVKALGARFGLEIKPGEWHSTDGDVLRVEKSVRMRIHRECHRCHAAFGTSNECPNCLHKRCKNCTRYPAKRTEEERQANRDRREVAIRRNKELAPIIPSYDYSDTIVLKRPGKPGGQDLVYKGKPRIRVRRNCHICNNLISTNAKQERICDNCGHKRCADCPRSPDARKKYPYGYPNDEPGSTFKGVHSCHECKKKFPANAEDGTECQRCSHAKCPDCPRVKPRKVELEPDPDVFENLRLHMEALKLKTADS
ncbi:hypothetical protein GGS23DRAFT_592079 [Durotheca rogersii]|uniref:uncharacterized protein n=1 Tax=Durotheca rogersii TaxID=419775 RepID=UPI00221EB75E|nr:uncharacterized protein GGS23DRAFT_592079 [Durotheca rogersii]KAI5868293.1 hypothetical protein GGS23DRAFT_592079 [Durotheca rogersii]